MAWNYQAIGGALRGRFEPVIEMTFRELDRLVGGLPVHPLVRLDALEHHCEDNSSHALASCPPREHNMIQPTTCRAAVVAALESLESRHGRSVFRLDQIVDEVEATWTRWARSTSTTHVSSHMCVDAPNHLYPDLARAGYAQYRRVQTGKPRRTTHNPAQGSTTGTASNFGADGDSPEDDFARSSRTPSRNEVLDGVQALSTMLQRAGYPTAMHAVAAHSIFVHPETVAQTNGQALFPVIRDFELRGQFGNASDGRRVLLDDNTSPTLAFCWSAQRKKGPDIQFNHVFTDSRNPDIYTALWNVCVTPAFLAKTTDGKNHPKVVAALRCRAFELYGFLPDGESAPAHPAGYDDLEWHESCPPVTDLEHILRRRMNRAPKSRPSIAAREIGWCFSNWEPDRTVSASAL